MALAASSQLPALSHRPVGLGLRHLDATGGAELAGLSPDWIGDPAGCRGLRIADPDLDSGTHRRRGQRSLLLPPGRRMDAMRRLGSSAAPGGANFDEFDSADTYYLPGYCPWGCLCF